MPLKLVMGLGALVIASQALGCGSTETKGGGAGGGGSGGQPTSTGGAGPGGSGGGGQGGGGGGCRMPADCGADDTCVSWACDAGACIATEAALGTPCTENGGNVCGDGACVAWAAVSQAGAPSARSKHTALWTGTRMIIWGGRTGPGAETDTGALYDPATDTWTAMSTTSAPAARHTHGAVWTGSEMIVWGGFGGGVSRNDGGAYDPTTDSWRPLAASGIGGRTNHVMEWTGAEVVVWGGRDGANLQPGGARYNPALDQWLPMSASPLAARFNAAAVWVEPGMNMPNGGVVMFGGANFFDWFSDGAFWDPVGNSWTVIPTTPGPAPAGGAPPGHPLEGTTSVTFQGSGAVYYWGGWDGGNHYDIGYFLSMYHQVGGYWFLLAPKPTTPSPRRFHVSAASKKTTGYFVWGGCDDSSCTTTLGDGGYWWQNEAEIGGTWVYIAEDPALPPRSDTAIVNTGDVVIIWGGLDSQGDPVDTGALRLMPDPPL
jgi:hypothetical protein